MTEEEENQLLTFSLYVDGVLSYHEIHSYFLSGDKEKYNIAHTMANQFARDGYAKNESRNGGDVSVLLDAGKKYYEKLKQKKASEQTAKNIQDKRDRTELNWWTKKNYENLKWVIVFVSGTTIAIIGLILHSSK